MKDIDWDEADDFIEDECHDEDDQDDTYDHEHEWVLDCGNDWCCMPGYHFRYECHRGGER